MPHPAWLSLALLTVPPSTTTVVVFDAQGAISPEEGSDLGGELEEVLADSGVFVSAADEDALRACPDDACRLKVARAVDAMKMVTVNVMRFGPSRCVLRAVLSDVGRGEPDAYAHSRTDCDLESIYRAVYAVAGKLQLAIDPGARPPSPVDEDDEREYPAIEHVPLVARGLEGRPRKRLTCSSADSCYDLGADLQNGKNGHQQDDVRAVDAFRYACREGHPAACTDLGYHIEMGRGAKVDLENAAAHYELGCSRGNQIGCANLAYMYENGRGVIMDWARAMRLYEVACTEGTARGCTSLGFMLENKNEKPANLARAAELYKQGCDGGNMIGCANYGYMAANGRGMTQDFAVAYDHHIMACDGEEGRGCTDVGFMYEKGCLLYTSDAADE